MATPTTLPYQVEPVNVYRGDTTTWPTYIFYADDGVTPINFTGYTWLAQWRENTESATPVVLTVDVSEAAVGQLSISATAAQTADFTGRGVWDLQGTNGSVIHTWARGAVTTVSDVSRA